MLLEIAAEPLVDRDVVELPVLERDFPLEKAYTELKVLEEDFPLEETYMELQVLQEDFPLEEDYVKDILPLPRLRAIVRTLTICSSKSAPWSSLCLLHAL